MELLHVSLIAWIASDILFTMVICSEGKGRVTIFAAKSNARTFDFQVNPVRLQRNFRSDTQILSKPGDIGMEQVPIRLLQLLIIIILYRLCPCKHGYEEV